MNCAPIPELLPLQLFLPPHPLSIANVNIFKITSFFPKTWSIKEPINSRETDLSFPPRPAVPGVNATPRNLFLSLASICLRQPYLSEKLSAVDGFVSQVFPRPLLALENVVFSAPGHTHPVGIHTCHPLSPSIPPGLCSPPPPPADLATPVPALFSIKYPSWDGPLVPRASDSLCSLWF